MDKKVKSFPTWLDVEICVTLEQFCACIKVPERKTSRRKDVRATNDTRSTAIFLHGGGGGGAEALSESLRCNDGAEALSESLRCNDMVADLHFPRFFGTGIKYELARRFSRSVVKVGLHGQCKNITISSGVKS